MEPDKSPDKYQQAWQTHSSQMRVTIDADSLLDAVQLNQLLLRATLSLTVLSGIVIPLLMVPIWIYIGNVAGSPWTWYLMVPALVWAAGFNLVVRPRRKQVPNESGKPLFSCVKESLTLVEHQIWYQRNAFWWSELPMAVALLVASVHTAWAHATSWLDDLSIASAFLFVFVVAIYGFIYYMHQRTVRTQYEPERQELLALLTSLQDETTSEVSGEYPVLMGKNPAKCTPRRLKFAKLGFMAIALVLMASIIFAVWYISTSTPALSERSPFAAVRWQQAQPVVKVGDEWFKLVSLDGLPAAEIVEFSQRTYGNMWQKRFEEDLVALLTRMGHPPRDTVTLVVQSLTSPETRTFEQVPMTRANRRAIWDAAQARERYRQ